MEEEVQGKTSFDFKKYLPIIGIVLAVIVLIIVLVSIFGGGPKGAVKKYINGINGKNASKVVDSMDFAGYAAWSEGRYDIKDFSKDDYEEFVDNYKEYTKENKDEIKEAKEEAKDSLKEGFDEMKDTVKSFKVKVEEVKSSDKLGKDLYAVKAKISVNAVSKDKDDDEIDVSNVATFVVYKNKIISTDFSAGI